MWEGREFNFGPRDLTACFKYSEYKLWDIKIAVKGNLAPFNDREQLFEGNQIIPQKYGGSSG